MKFKLDFFLSLTIIVLSAASLSGQNSPAPDPTAAQSSAQANTASAAEPPQGAVSYASVTELNGLLGQLESTSNTAQVDLAKLRIERWKTDGTTKKQSLADVESVQRNLHDALPGMIDALHASPEDLPATFKLYRNLDALYDVMGGVVESAGAFGSKDDFQALTNDLNGFEGARKQLAERLENLAGTKEQEIVRLRAELKTAQAAAPPPAPPKKIVVDDTEPEKKPPAKKKPAVKKPAAPKPNTTPPNNPQTPQPQPNPQ
jgi:TolA-binding protein